MKLRDSILRHAGFLILLSRAVVGYENGLARTPQMGWNTWNRFGCDIDEDLIVESAKVVAENLRVYGYECECRPPYTAPLTSEPGCSLTCSFSDIVMDDCPCLCSMPPLAGI